MTLTLGSVTASSDPIDQADWLEVKALVSADGNSSFQDLVAELRRNGSTDATEESAKALADSRGEISERLASDVFSELEDRQVAAGEGYPFGLSDQSVRLTQETPYARSTYIFLLLLSYIEVPHIQVLGSNPQRDFEDISQTAAESFFGHNEHDGSYLFAFPRRGNESSFIAAVHELTKQIGEGGGAREGIDNSRQKDAGLDVVVWHGFKDSWPGRLIAFGQCASGKNWTAKLTELPSTTSWCQTWMNTPPIVEPVRMFFMPHRMTSRHWKVDAAKAGIVFERCRIAYHAPQPPNSVRDSVIRWSEAVLESSMRE